MSSSYDRAVTIFSPDGHLLQVEYAQEAVNKGAAAVGVRGDNCIVLGVEKKIMGRLQEDRTIRKICALDQHVVMAFAGLNADARVLINRAQIECQSHRLNLADPVTLEYITRYISEVKQKYTQSNGRRPFGLSCLIGGFDADGSAHLYQTNPSGTFHEYNANAIGRSAKFVLKFFEENYRAEDVNTEFGAVKLAIRALLEVAQSGQQNLDVVIMEYGKLPRMLHHNDLLKYVELIEKENEEKLEKKQQKK